MPLAAHITALPASASPALLERAGAPVSATASTQKFSELFREQTGALPVAFPAPSPKPAVTTAKSNETNAAPEPSHKTEASSLTEQALTEQAESASATAITPVSSQASSQIPSQSQSPSAANTVGNAVQTLAEASEVSLSSLAAESKDTASLSQRTTIGSPHKASENSQVSKPRNKESETPLAATGQLVAQSVLPVISSQIPPRAAQSTTASSALGQTSAATNGNRGTSAVNMAKPTEERDAEAGSSVPPQSGSAEDHSAVPLAQGTQQVTGNQTPSSASSVAGAATQQSAHTAADGSASSKESPSSALPHSSVAQQNAHAPAEQTAGGATAASSATPAEAHSIDAGSLSPSPSRMEQPSGAAPSASTNPPANVATSLYEKIDQGAAPVVLHSGAQHVAVGVRDPDLGWIEIKTQNTAGQLAATLVTTSSQTHATLAAQLPAMTQYLHERDVRVGTLAVQQQMPGGNSGSGPGNGSGNSGSGAQNPNHPNSGSQGAAAQHTGVSPGFLTSGLLQPGIEDAGSSLRPVSYISIRA
ncbi:MAG: hypothetical protein WA419_12120 [Silvibacterium sp.]